jgi:hypothetical protein
MLYFLVMDMYPRFLVMLNEELNGMHISLGQMSAIRSPKYSVSD